MNTFKMYRRSATNEFVIRTYKNGILYKEADYFTNDRKDALATMALLARNESRATDFLAGGQR